MTISIEELRTELAGKQLPGGELLVEPYESVVADTAFRASDPDTGVAHPAWFVAASTRCMGITVDDLCELAHQAAGDTLLFGRCEVEQLAPIAPGVTYSSTATITDVDSRTIRDGSRLDSIRVVVTLADGESLNGRITSDFLFKRAGEAAR